MILNSRFIASGAEVCSAKEAETFLKQIQARYPDANHHCYAFKVLGPPLVERFSDDGEPNGTAGRPILTVLEHHLSNSIIVVTRYFGGTKLGKGGLVKAYTEAAKHVIETLGTVRREQEISIQCQYPYALSAYLDYWLRQHHYPSHLDYGAEIRAQLKIPASQWSAAQKQLELWQLDGLTWQIC